MMLWTVFLFLLTALADDGATKQPAKLAGQIVKGREALEIVPAKDGVLVRIKHAGGIGAAEVMREEGEWPKLRLELAGFQSLEFFELSTDQVKLSTSLRQAPAAQVQVRQSDGSFGDDPKKDRWKVAMTQKGNTIVIELPAELCPKDVKVLRIGWIDAFRR